jgi:hypothetical protein
VWVPNALNLTALPSRVHVLPRRCDVKDIFSGELVAETRDSQPLQVCTALPVDFLFTFRNQADDGGNLNVRAFPRDPNNAKRGTLRATFIIHLGARRPLP